MKSVSFNHKSDRLFGISSIYCPLVIVSKSASVKLDRIYFSNSADMSFEGDTSEGSKNSNSNDGGGGADADLVYFDESEMRFVFF